MLVAADIAFRAGRRVRPLAGAAPGLETKSGPADLVTAADRESESFIRARLAERFPDHRVFGEEQGGESQGELVWHVDPIDGTTNFVHGLPGFCVSLALAERGRPVAAAVYDPVGDELFTAGLGEGATANGRPLAVSAESTLGEALLGTGFPPVDPGKSWAIASIGRVAQEARNVRNFGSAALHLSYVAAGRLSGFWEPGLRSWDVAAGVLLVREAGGRATSLTGEEWHTAVRGCLGTNGRVHAEILGVLAGLPPPPGN